MRIRDGPLDRRSQAVLAGESNLGHELAVANVGSETLFRRHATQVFTPVTPKRLHDTRSTGQPLRAGQVMPIHAHDIEGQLSLQVVEGRGQFLGKDQTAIPAKTGDFLISEISEPHGFRAETDVRLLVTIAPPI